MRRGPGVSAEDVRELAEIADLVLRWLDPGWQYGGVTIDPDRMHAAPVRSGHVGIGAVPDVHRLGRAHAEAVERGLENHRQGLAPPDLVGHHDRLEQVDDALALEHGSGGRRVVE